eukprot:GEMP01011950.1.p1 GENE.GEMP01011950.1~~GEMP01011950.1.p1  ORF type:complete len:994 (+),score=243.62 GEMP01011950.1:65-3046(+)
MLCVSSANSAHSASNKEGVLIRAFRLLREGAFDEARQLFFELYEEEEFADDVDIDRAYVHIERALGDCFAGEKRFEESFEWYRRAYWKDRAHVGTLYSLACVELERKSYITAVQYSTELLQLNPNHAGGLALRAQLRLRSGSLDLALADITHLRSFDAARAAVLEDELTELRRAACVAEPVCVPSAPSWAVPIVKAGERSSDARELMLESRYHEAIRLLKDGKRSAEESLMLASALARQANYDDAKRCLLEMLCENMRSSSNEAAFGAALLAHVYERTCEYDRALIELKKVRGLRCAGAYLGLIVEGQCAEARGDWVSAATLYRHVSASCPHPIASLRLGYVRLQQRNYEDAAAQLARVEELASTDPCFDDAIGFANRKTIRGAALVYRGIANHLSGGTDDSSADFFWRATELHDNFRCVQQSMSAIDKDVAAQTLRGICDLDLSSEEAYAVVSHLRDSAQRTFAAVAPCVSITSLGVDLSPKQLRGTPAASPPTNANCSSGNMLGSSWSPTHAKSSTNNFNTAFSPTTSSHTHGPTTPISHRHPSSLLSSMPLSSTASSTRQCNGGSNVQGSVSPDRFSFGRVPAEALPPEKLWLFPKVNVSLSAAALPMCQLGPAVKPLSATTQIAPLKTLTLPATPFVPIPPRNNALSIPLNAGKPLSAPLLLGPSPASRTPITRMAGPLFTPSLPSTQLSAVGELLPTQDIFHRADVCLGNLLGEGSFGSVYKAHVRGYVCACKLIHTGGPASHAAAEAEFLKEVDSFKHLVHPRLVRFFGVVMEDVRRNNGRSIVGMLTEYMENGNLYSMLFGANPRPTARARSLPTDLRFILASDVIEGLAFLHAHRPPVVHRDMKSMNVLLDAGFHAKLCDFGLTQPLEAGKTHLTRQGTEKGSPRYMGPEYYDERLTLTAKVDIWAFGCTLAEIFGGTVPYCECSTLQQLCGKIMIEKVAPSIPRCEPRIMEIMAACFEFNPRQRITAAEIIDKLHYITTNRENG